MEKRLTVVFDDDCPTCTVMKNMSERLDREKRIEFVGMNTESGRKLVRSHNLDMHKSAYAMSDGNISAKSRMVRDVLAHNGVIGLLMSLPFRIPFFGDLLYNLIARHRDHAMKD